jgi:hypothetical protein
MNRLCTGAALPKSSGVGRKLGPPLYTDEIHDDERRLWDGISVTDLDAEIRVAKLQLKRLLAAQRRAELNEDAPAETPLRRRRRVSA